MYENSLHKTVQFITKSGSAASVKKKRLESHYYPDFSQINVTLLLIFFFLS